MEWSGDPRELPGLGGFPDAAFQVFILVSGLVYSAVDVLWRLLPSWGGFEVVMEYMDHSGTTPKPAPRNRHP